ncbi:MAG TPA: tryptophan--tRNA ligase [bacterium]|nr:tryptophan--tRNA ligase [bacterium]
MRILSGMRPTGRLHLGNLLGALTNWKNLQEKYECFYMVADLHALTTDYADTREIKRNIREMVIDWLASGIDPKKSTIFIQSQIPEHSELYLLLSMFTPIPWLERCPTYKEQLKEIKGKDLRTYGFLGYPVLQAADILIYKAEVVPVGEDQLPHLELTREIARRFNHLYKDIFPIPQAKLTKVPRFPGIDGRKMSKSYNNCIYLSDSDEVIKEKIEEAITDPARKTLKDKGHPDICTIFNFHQIYNRKNVKDVEARCKKAQIGCRECKRNLANTLASALSDFHRKRKELLENPEKIDKILKEGRKKASSIAKQTLEEVKRVMGI